ncbi:MAG: MurT ligase domain-containing protein [Eubacteriales bacterium]|nr:MurT ligase domain-containing protein [Eubacteriales bacterium]
MNPEIEAKQLKQNVLTVLITGTNGKTTIAHLLKHIFRQAGVPIYSNIHWEDDREERAESFFETVAESRKQAEPAVFILEVDEGDFAYFAQKLKPEMAIVANLSRNQLYLYGELNGIVTGLKEGLAAAPDCELICCADDPLVAGLAKAVDKPERVFYYGLAEHEAGPNYSADDEHFFMESPHCSFCGALLDYDGLSFSNYGNYSCPDCDFSRPKRDLEFKELGGTFRESLYSFRFASGLSAEPKSGSKSSLEAQEHAAELRAKGSAQGLDEELSAGASEDFEELKIALHLPALLNAYNAAAAALLARRVGLSAGQIRQGLERCLPPRGRFERFIYEGQEICLLRGENPEALNTTLAWALNQADCGALLLALDDPEKNHAGDISWLWDVLFEKLPYTKLIGLAGTRAHDLALRLLYAGVEAERIQLIAGQGQGQALAEQKFIGELEEAELSAAEIELLLKLMREASPKTVYFLADKTAAHRLRPELLKIARSEIDLIREDLTYQEAYGDENKIAELSSYYGFKRDLASPKLSGRRVEAKLSAADSIGLDSLQVEATRARPELKYSLNLAYLYPQELNLYGDRGNVLCLKERARYHGIDLKVSCIGRGDRFDPEAYEIVFMGGGQDSDQDSVYADFVEKAADIRAAVESGVVFLCICGAYQLMGKNYITAAGREIEGLGILDLETRGLGRRMVGDLVFRPPGKGRGKSAAELLLGYENHGGETFLGPAARAMGQVIRGFGNNSCDEGEGCVYKNLFGTYAHGAFLPRNPEMADHLLKLAWAKAYPGQNFPPAQLELDDSIALTCRAEVFRRLKIDLDEERT